MWSLNLGIDIHEVREVCIVTPALTCVHEAYGCLVQKLNGSKIVTLKPHSVRYDYSPHTDSLEHTQTTNI
jgi:hypothetical protein